MKIAHKLCVFCANIAPSIALNVAPYPHKTASARVSAPNYPASTMNPKPIAHPDAPDAGIAPPAPHSALPAFGLIVVGDEILLGRRADKHIPKVIELLGARALSLSYVHIVGDEPARLVTLLRQACSSGDVVLCCGGIGATPDDHTRQAAAAALGVDLHMHPQARALIEQRMREHSERKNEAFEPTRADNLQRLQMACLPQGAQIIPNPFNRIPGFSVGHVHCFPGFPIMTWPMMEWVLDSYYTPWQHLRDWCELALIVSGRQEAVLTALMQHIEQQWPDVKVFSLPSINHPVYGSHIELGVKGAKQSVQAAFTALQQGLQALGASWQLPD